MGKSDQILFPWYAQSLDESCGLDFSSIALLGFSKENDFTKQIRSPTRDLFDLTLNDWDINDESWNITSESYDLVVCTRCAYFAREPLNAIKESLRILKPGGSIFFDWGLGDHWRSIEFKIGWTDNQDDHDFTVIDGSIQYLWSCFWDKDMEREPEARQFFEWCPVKYLKRSLSSVVLEEVPSIMTSSDLKPSYVRLKALWPDSPQLYVITVFKK